MTILSNLASSRVRNRSMGVLHLIAADESCEVSDILALLIPPSQPNPQEQAADTSKAPSDVKTGEESPPASPVVPSPDHVPDARNMVATAPQPISTPAEQVHDEPANLQAASSHPISPLGAESTVDPAPNLARKDTLRVNLAALHEQHPDWPPKIIAQHLEVSEGIVRATANQMGIKLASWWDYERAQKKATTEALKAEVAPKPTVTPEQLPAVVAVPFQPAPEADATDVLHRVNRAPQGRLYLRDKTTQAFVHQSLQPAKGGNGPMMTDDRKWAWYDTMERYRGARNRWPQIADMRKEAARS